MPATPTTIAAILSLLAIAICLYPWHRCPVCGRRFHHPFNRDWHVAWHHASAILTLALLAGCSSSATPNTTPTNRYNTTALTNTAAGIDSSAQTIKTTARDGNTQAPNLPHWTRIEGLSDSIINYVAVLRDTAKAYTATDQQYTAELDKRDRKIADQDKKLAEAAAANDANTRWVWRAGLLIAAVLTVGGPIVSKLGSPKAGMLMILGGLSLLVLSQTMLTYGPIVALIGAALLAFTCALLAYELWHNRHQLAAALQL